MDKETSEHIQKLYSEIERLKSIILKMSRQEEDYSDLIKLED